MTASLDTLDRVAAAWLARADRPLVLGLCGPQGSGKSTLATGLAARAEARGRRAAILSIDDLYLPGDRRAELARSVHPLLRTRGVPMTHDVATGRRLLADIRSGRPARLPRFDKARDEPCPPERWQPIDGAHDLLIFEGWCVGAMPQPEAALAEPVNALERDEDPEGIWRRAVNTALAGPYSALFGLIDRLVLLAPPGFEVVRGWRAEQEATLRQECVARGLDTAGLMDDDAIERFVQHYERLSRHILAEMPTRADLALRLDTERNLVSVRRLEISD